MPAQTYLDFDLRIRREGDGYVAELPDAGTRQAFRLPFTEEQLEIYLLKIGQRASGMRRPDSPESKAAREFGAKLFDAVFQGDLLARFRARLAEARDREAGLRLRLRLDEAPELADLPWEYLYETSRRQFLCLSKDTPIVRLLDVPDPPKPLSVRPPLRALVAVATPTDQEELDVEREINRLRKSVEDLTARGLLTLDFLPVATLEELQRQLRRADYHIFHFIGHGIFDAGAQEGVLLFENAMKRSQPVTGQDLAVYLRDATTLRLVILNACEGARAGRKDPFAGVAQVLLLQGLPAVVAMQFAVSDKAAATFAQGLYGALADGLPVDAALAEARKSVFGLGDSVEWGTPVLYLNAPDGRIFDVPAPAPPAPALPLPPAPETEKVTEPPLLVTRAGSQPSTPPAPAKDTEYVPVADKVAMKFDGLKRLWNRNRLLAGGVMVVLIALGVAMLWREFWSEPGTDGANATTTNNPSSRVAKTPSTNQGARPDPVVTGRPTAKAFTNSLGMVFVPVPGTDVLFSVWETRVQDFAAYAAASPGRDDSWQDPELSGDWYGRFKTSGPLHPVVKVTPGPLHPVVKVNWEDATNFCAWLTTQDRAEGLLTGGQHYRLPTDAEWSWAVGIGEREGDGTPKEKNDQQVDEDWFGGEYTWGTPQRVPPAGAANIADEALKKRFPRDAFNISGRYRDGYATTSPVGSFAANRHGLFDLAGNVQEWCEDWYDTAEAKLRVARGGSWFEESVDGHKSRHRHRYTPDGRYITVGFRVVLASGSSR